VTHLRLLARTICKLFCWQKCCGISAQARQRWRLFSDDFALAISVFAFAFSYFARYKDD